MILRTRPNQTLTIDGRFSAIYGCGTHVRLRCADCELQILGRSANGKRLSQWRTLRFPKIFHPTISWFVESVFWTLFVVTLRQRLGAKFIQKKFAFLDSESVMHASECIALQWTDIEEIVLPERWNLTDMSEVLSKVKNFLPPLQEDGNLHYLEKRFCGEDTEYTLDPKINPPN